MGLIKLNSCEVRSLCQSDPLLGVGISLIGDITYFEYSNAFEFVISSIIGQMLSNRVASIIEARFHAICNMVTPESVSNLSVEQLRSIGLSMNKAKCIANLCSFCLNKPDFFDSLHDLTDDRAIKELIQIQGIGTWTAKMYLLFVLQRSDVLPFEDGAFLQAYRWLYRTGDLSPAAIIERCKCWHPYASIASRYLYRMLDMGFTKYPSVYDLDQESIIQR